MFRKILIAGGMVALGAVAVPSFGQGADYKFGSLSTEARSGAPANAYGPPQELIHPRLSARDFDQIVRWGGVGRCVAGYDRETSRSLVSAKRKSAVGVAAAKRLDPLFASCLEGSGVVATGNKALRRAAIADALAVKPT